MKHIFANWKMYLNLEESTALAQQLVDVDYDTKKIHLALFPSTLAFTNVKTVYKDAAAAVGSQNVVWTPKGAYTGAVSAEMFVQAGAEYALVGHSERRHIFGESDGDVKKKFDACIDAGITPVLCIGETKEDLDANKREYRLKKQLMSALEGVEPATTFFIAYEPVWAIGTGEPCDHLVVADIHDMIKAEVKLYTDQNIPVVYGGSVDAANVVSYLSHDNVDGVLVGHASAVFEQFVPLIRAVEKV